MSTHPPISRHKMQKLTQAYRRRRNQNLSILSHKSQILLFVRLTRDSHNSRLICTQNTYSAAELSSSLNCLELRFQLSN
jgi:hypothetical protein